MEKKLTYFLIQKRMWTLCGLTTHCFQTLLPSSIHQGCFRVRCEAISEPPRPPTLNNFNINNTCQLNTWTLLLEQCLIMTNVTKCTYLEYCYFVTQSLWWLYKHMTLGAINKWFEMANNCIFVVWVMSHDTICQYRTEKPVKLNQRRRECAFFSLMASRGTVYWFPKKKTIWVLEFLSLWE